MSVSTPASVGSDSPPDEGALVSVRNLKKYFPITRGIIFQREVGRVQAVDDISFDIYPGETSNWLCLCNLFLSIRIASRPATTIRSHAQNFFP